jgi:hypothetical protein
MLSCYDKFLFKKIKENELCVKCCNYYGLSEKRKAQHQMGVRYRCVHPSNGEASSEKEDETVAEASSNRRRFHQVRYSNFPSEASEASSDVEALESSSDEVMASPPRKATKPSNTPPRFASTKEVMTAIEFSHSSSAVQSTGNGSDFIHSLMASVNRLHEQLEKSNAMVLSKETEISSLRQELSSTKRYLQRSTKKLHLVKESNSTISNTAKAT